MGFKSGWYGGSRRIICPFSFAISSIIYCGSGLFAFAKANNSGRNSFLSNGMLCFVNQAWMSALNLDITITLFTEMFAKSFSQDHFWKFWPFISLWQSPVLYVAFHTSRAPGTNPVQPPPCTTIRRCPLLIRSKAPISSLLCQQYFAVKEVSIHFSSM